MKKQILIFVLLIVKCFCSFSQENSPKDSTETFIQKWTNKPLPNFDLKTLHGKTISSKDLKGKMVHINFWDVSCKPCIMEFVDLNKINKKYKNKVVCLAFVPESEEKVNEIVQKNKLDYAIVPNSLGYFQLLGITSFPENFFVDKNGIIRTVTEASHFKLVNKKMVSDNFDFFDKILKKLAKK